MSNKNIGKPSDRPLHQNTSSIKHDWLYEKPALKVRTQRRFDAETVS